MKQIVAVYLCANKSNDSAQKFQQNPHLTEHGTIDKITEETALPEIYYWTHLFCFNFEINVIPSGNIKWFLIKAICLQRHLENK